MYSDWDVQYSVNCIYRKSKNNIQCELWELNVIYPLQWWWWWRWFVGFARKKRKYKRPITINLSRLSNGLPMNIFEILMENLIRTNKFH